MTTNLFKSAIASNQVNEFFRGDGSYHVASPDYEGHVYGANMGGHARTYADFNLSNCKQFDVEFLKFLGSFLPSKEDLNHLLANISAYFSQKIRGGFANSKLFESDSSPGSIAVKEFLLKVKKTSFAAGVDSQINRHAVFMRTA